MIIFGVNTILYFIEVLILQPPMGLNRFFIGVNEYDSYEMLTFASWKTKVC